MLARWLLAALLGWAAGPLAAAEVRLAGQTFTLAEGCTLERAAGPPLVERPITVDWDERGRLYVAESGGTNDRPAVQLETRPNRIVRLEDTDGDGRFDRRTLFADRIPFPEGTLWYEGSLYVAAPPSIWKLTDTDDDGVADVRVEWFQGRTLTGCGNDLHGPYLGPDGRIYWCKGAWAEQTYARGPGQPPWVTKAAHVFRARPDGSEIEAVVTTGMDNPVDLVFTREGERIVSGTFVVNPGGGQRDGIFHALLGGVYGKRHAVVEALPRTSPDMLPVLAHHGPAATCGMARAESACWDEAGQQSLFVCLFNLRAVRRHVLAPQGATYRTVDADLLVSDNWDFHPTDVQEDADGSLLVVDTGGWYKICCPTSQLVKPDVLGGLYRVRRSGAAPPADPRGLGLDWSGATDEQLVARLGDARFAVRERARQALARRGAAALPALGRAYDAGDDAALRQAILWTAARIDAPEARALARRATQDPRPAVRGIAWHAVSLWRDAAQAPPEPLARTARLTGFVGRVRAEALGRSGATAALLPLLGTLAEPVDWAYEHSVIHAVREGGDAAALRRVLDGDEPLSAGELRGALLALETLAPQHLTPRDALRLLAQGDPRSRAAALWLGGRHSAWSAQAVPAWQGLPPALQARLAPADVEDFLAIFGDAPAVQDWAMQELLRAEGSARLFLRCRWTSVPDGVVRQLAEYLAARRPEEAAVLRALTALPLTPAQWATLRPALARRLEDPQAGREVQGAALAAWSASRAALTPELLALLRRELEQPESARRLAALQVLNDAPLSPEQAVALAPLARQATWQELDRWLALVGRRGEDAPRLAVLAAAAESPAWGSLRAEQLRQHFPRPSPPVAERLEALARRLEADLAARQAQLDRWLAAPPAGDVRRGQALFTAAATNCMACHQVGYVGGTLGPDLTRIGAIRTERDLLEAVLFPSAAIARGYESTTLELDDGRIVSGRILADSPDEIVLALTPPQTLRVPRRAIAAQRPSTTSLMPAGLDKQLSPQQLADLVAFLKSCR